MQEPVEDGGCSHPVVVGQAAQLSKATMVVNTCDTRVWRWLTFWRTDWRGGHPWRVAEFAYLQQGEAPELPHPALVKVVVLAHPSLFWAAGARRAASNLV